MPFACHLDILKKYLVGHNDNLNPLLRKMVADGVILYGVPPRDDLELININNYDEYLQALKKHSID